MINATVFESEKCNSTSELGKPLLENDFDENSNNKSETRIIRRTEIQVNFVWLFLGLMFGLCVQIIWTSGVFMALSVLATWYSVRIAMIVVTALLVSKCMCLNYVAFRVIQDIEGDGADDDDEDGDGEEYDEEAIAARRSQGEDIREEINLKSYAPIFELMIGGVFGMFFMALALQIAPLITP
mmetsp:Transcript_11489/g.15127  ORF Transcript_11489/g.15127 Transcript_11489/m.15127 type:complete len:183 (-) Transcript_11489:55-603(-)|eukprot:CAMPEP_0198141450 /NCGR_PEP_ID=MMETSP1443-20131203/4456_1 /TAXON_ID=186043 /ORGANISM="Entomoneis sp., Strain CCMP2396" /LENGTH=182 /DNA_ID=CAMNT_0043804203 /DNA_START=159 /DNA_END=707 /DNA_ORIENTATION=-